MTLLGKHKTSFTTDDTDVDDGTDENGVPFSADAVLICAIIYIGVIYGKCSLG
jgi:hypothetical protein